MNHTDVNKMEHISQDLNKEELKNLVDTTLLETFVENISDCIENPICSSVSSNNINASITPSDIMCSKSNDDHDNINGDSSCLTESCNIMVSEYDDGSSKLTGFESIKDSLNENSGYMSFDDMLDENSEKYNDEEFQDSVNFFNDPSFLNFLENASRLSDIPLTPSEIRNSLYKKFDPLYEKYFSQEDLPSNELPINADDAADKNYKTSYNSPSNNVENDFNDSNMRQSVGNMLISLDSPKKDSSIFHHRKTTVIDSHKVFTEEDLRRALEVQELEMRGNFMRKEKALQELFSSKLEELEAKLQKQTDLSYALYTVVKEAMHLINVVAEKKQLLEVQLSNEDLNKTELKDFTDASKNKLQNKTFTLLDFFKEIDQSKNVFEITIKNESIMKQLESMNAQLNGKEGAKKELV